MKSPTLLSDSSKAADVRWWDTLLAVHALAEHRAGEVLRRHGLGVSEYRALEFLAAAPHGRLRMQDLAEDLGLNQSSVSRLVGRLHRAGFGDTDLCPEDGRGVVAVITAAGRARFEQARPSYQRVLTEALDQAGDMIHGGGKLIAAIRAVFAPDHGWLSVSGSSRTAASTDQSC
ncbi:MarR family transcriptional regulator [Nocardia transvalensis]|nr:MarR family transcriptional regulator [Nocardia transvalensis]